MQLRRPIAWYPVLLAAYLLVISVAIITLDRAAILASHPAYALTLAMVAILAAVVIVWSLVRRR
jgi:hypothetical protein